MNALRGGLVLFLFGLCVACASTGRGASRVAYDPNLLTSAEISSLNVPNLYEVVFRLRPTWLSVRGGPRSLELETGVVVYQGQTFLGGVEALRQAGPEMAYELRYMDGPTASASLPGLGSRHVVGAIIIVTSPR